MITIKCNIHWFSMFRSFRSGFFKLFSHVSLSQSKHTCVQLGVENSNNSVCFEDILLVSNLKASNRKPGEQHHCENLKFSIAAFLI